MTSQGPTVEKIIAEAFCKAAEVILEGRIYSSGPSKPTADAQRGRAWFNLEVAEVQGAAKALERWRRESGLPLVLEVFLQPWGAQAAAAAGGQQCQVETLLERWVLHYCPQLPEAPSRLSRSQLSRLNPSSVYKRLVVTLRSLYTLVRVLPAYRMYRACKRQRGSTFTLGYRLHSTLPGRSAAAAPGARRMQAFRFGAVDTPYGQFRMAVDYQPASTVTILEQTTSAPALPHIISDYVGSPRRGGGGAAGSSSSTAGSQPLRHAASATAVGSAAGPLPVGSAGTAPAPAAVSPRAGGFIRRSWSSGLRGASPHRTQSQPAELPASPSARDTPYGSAPQPASLPAMLRALSTPAGRCPVGSPAGRPPLAKPPRAATAPLAAVPGGHAASYGGPVPAIGSGSHSPAGGSALAAAAGAADEDAGDAEQPSQGSTPRSRASAGSGARQSSAPMSIPRRGGLGDGAAGRRLRSSGDLWALQQAAHMRKPLSAPATSHMQAAAAAAASPPAPAAAGMCGDAAAAAGPGGSAAPSAPPSPSPPAAARLQHIPGAVDSESSGSAASSLYPTSCSPQLPFAFTPSAQSLASFGARGALQESARLGLERISPRPGRAPYSGGSSVPHQAAAQALAAHQQQQQARAAAAAAAAGGGSAGCSPGNAGGVAVTGREVPASTALMRRPSWPSRSSYNQLSGEASQPGVGYSVSPMQDATLESLLAGSTPRQFSLGTAGLPSPLSHGGMLAHGGGAAAAGGAPAGAPISHHISSAASNYSAAPPMLTFPSAPELAGAADEADVLPFALDDGSASPLKPRSPAPAGALPPAAEPLPVSTPASTSRGPAPPPAAAPAAAVDADAAVGAFVRLIQEAPPLRLRAAYSGPMQRAASADLLAQRLPAAAPGSSSGSDSSAVTCLSDGRGLTLQAGLRQFSRIRERLQARGIMPAPCPAEA